jgi:nuclear cap-binding protein subunit 1
VSIADSPLRRWAEEVLSLANMVADNYDDEHMRNNYINLVLQMVLEQPLKTPFVAAVVLVANALKPEAMEIVLERVAKDLESAIAAGQWREIKLYLKFLACLQGNLESDGVFPLLEELFNRAADLQTASSEDVSA